MEPTIKVVKKDIRGSWGPEIDEDKIANEIQQIESSGWSLISSFGVTTPVSGTHTVVFIYRKQS